MVSGEYESPIKCAERWLTTSDRNKKLSLSISKPSDKSYWNGNVSNMGYSFNATLHIYFQNITKGAFNLLQPPPSWELQRMDVRDVTSQRDVNEGLFSFIFL